MTNAKQKRRPKVEMDYMSAPAPILLTREEAREYLAGIDPSKVAPPIRYGRNIRWSRLALDLCVRKDAGLEPEPDIGGSPYDAWRGGRAD